MRSSSSRTYSSRSTRQAATSGAGGGEASFAQQVIQLLDEARFTSTYKYALLLALLDICLEDSTGDEPNVPTKLLAERMVELYWPQALPYVNERLLRQSGTLGQARIISLIAGYRSRRPDGPAAIAQARRQDKDGINALVIQVERVLFKDVLGKLQAFGGTITPFIFKLGPSVRPGATGTRSWFPNGLELLPGVREHLIYLDPVLRPLIQLKWMERVARLHSEEQLSQIVRLRTFMFGSPRLSLTPIMEDLRVLQGGKCFYCGRKVTEPHVDHFIPWSRHPDNTIDNLVFADQECNLKKKAFLAGTPHVLDWLRRFDPRLPIYDELSRVARDRHWERAPTRTLGAARTIYSLNEAGRVWVWQLGLVSEDLRRIRNELALKGIEEIRPSL